MLQTFERFIDLYLYFARSFGDVIFAGSNSEPMAFEHGGIFMLSVWLHAVMKVVTIAGENQYPGFYNGVICFFSALFANFIPQLKESIILFIFTC